jgi:hypothetical protein
MTFAADLVVVAHPGFARVSRAVGDVLEVVAEYGIGTLYPVTRARAEVELVEVHRHDMPWGRPPPTGSPWTSDEELESIYSRLAYGVQDRVVAFVCCLDAGAGRARVLAAVPSVTE